MTASLWGAGGAGGDQVVPKVEAEARWKFLSLLQ